MRRLIFNIILFSSFSLLANAQEKTAINMTPETVKDTSMKPIQNYANVVSFGGKYFFNTLKNTRDILATNGFVMDEQAFEYQLRIYNLPKIFYFQQLGTLSNTNYASVTGLGLKEDVRFDIVNNPHFILTPYIEFGGGFYRMNIAKGIKSNSISSVLGSQVENYFVDNFVISGDAGLDLGFGFYIDDHRLNVIFNGGYIVNYPSEWRLAGSLAFKEKINLMSPYAGVTVRLDMKSK
ncbi:MAG: hypothetical protein WBO36_13280 [Saprospiraceae bacterium]